MSKSFKEKLKMAGQLWKKAKGQVKEGGRIDYDDGTYVARLTKAEVQESKGSGRLQIQWVLRFLDGDYKFKDYMGFDGLETEQNMMYGVGPKILTLGFDAPESIEEIMELLEEVTKKKPFLKIQLKTKAGSEFQNLNFLKLLDEDDVSDLVGEEGSEEAGEEASEEASEEAEEEEKEEEATLEEGQKVSFTFKGEVKEGEVLTVLADEEKVRIKCVRDGKIYSVGFDKVEVPSDVPEEPEVEEEVEEEEKPSKTKKVAKVDKKVKKVKK